MRKLYENFHIFHFQKKIVSAETIRCNTIGHWLNTKFLKIRNSGLVSHKVSSSLYFEKSVHFSAKQNSLKFFFQASCIEANYVIILAWVMNRSIKGHLLQIWGCNYLVDLLVSVAIFHEVFRPVIVYLCIQMWVYRLPGFFAGLNRAMGHTMGSKLTWSCIQIHISHLSKSSVLWITSITY